MSLIVCPASQVEVLVRRRAPTHVLSLISPDAAAPELGLPADNHLVLRFNDINEARLGLVAPSQAMVTALIAFSDRCPAGASLLIHCFAGISRSPAAAYIIACHRAGPAHAKVLAALLRERAPTATPNSRLIALADQTLGAHGAMVRAAASLGRGALAFEGAPFDYP